MPAFNTGNAAWDQGLGNLSGALFPDPSKIAQAGYMGAEQRNKQLQSSKLRDQMAHQQGLDQAASTLTMPQTSYAPSPEGPNMPPIMQPPGSAPASPPTLSATVAPGPAAVAPPSPAAPAPAPAAPVAPAAGTVGANMAPGGLSGLFAGGGGAVPDGGSTVRLDQGTPPPVSSPAQGAGAPPAPNNTASDGSVPTNDAVSGVFHPGSITAPGGGTKTTGPANANGSPAKPMITAAQYVAMAVGAGHDANQAMLEWRSMISSMYDTGRIDENTYHHMMGSADPSIINTDSTNAANIKRTGMEQAGATTRMGMEQAGATTRAGMPTTFVADDPSDPTKGHYVPLAQQQGPGGTASFAPAATTTAAAPVLTQAKPGAPVIPSTQGQAARSGTPVYTAGTADITQQQGGAYDTYMDPKNPGGQPITTTAADAATRGLVKYGTMTPTPLKPAEQNQQSFIDHGVDQSVYQQPQKGSLTSPGFVDAPVVFSDAAQAKIQALTTQIMRSGQAGGNASNARGMAIRVLQGSGDLPSVGQVNALRNQGGVVSTAGGRVSDPRLAQSPTYDGTGKVVPHLWVGLKGETNPNDPGAPTAFNPEPGPRAGSKTVPQQQQQQQQSAPVASGPAYRPLNDVFGSGGGPPAPGTTPGPAPVPFFQRFMSKPAASGPAPLTTQQMYGGVPTAPPAPAAPAAPAAPNQPIARAAPNQRDGEIAYLNGRPIGIVRGGAVYPMPAQAGPGGGG